MSSHPAPVRSRGLALLLLALLVAGGPGLTGEPAPAADLAEASRLAAAGKDQEALAVADKLLALSPQNVPAQRLRQDLMLKAGRRGELLAGYTQAEANATMRPLMRYLRARAEPTAEKRRAELERILAMDPKNFWAAYDLVPLCTAAGDLKAAERWATAARDLRPGDPDVRNVLGDVYLQAGKLKEAEAELGEALKLRPKFPQALYNLGLVRAGAGKFKDAAEFFAKAAEEDPGFAEAWNNRGHCLTKLEKNDEAIACYRKAVELKPDYGSAWNNLAVALYRKNDLWAAWAALEKAEKAGYAVAESFKRVLAKKLFPDKEKPAPQR
jgi:Flp pilus assembly protein TadD